jgi:hypothetical protein
MLAGGRRTPRDVLVGGTWTMSPEVNHAAPYPSTRTRARADFRESLWPSAPLCHCLVGGCASEDCVRVPAVFQISLAAFISERVFTTLNHATGAAAAGQLIRLRSHMRYGHDQIELTGHARSVIDHVSVTFISCVPAFQLSKNGCRLNLVLYDSM